MARRYWPGDHPVGKHLTLAFMGPALAREVVGIVSDVRHAGLDDTPRPTVFLPHAQSPSGSITFVVRTAGDPRALLGAVRGAIWAISPTMPIASTTTLDHLRAESLRDRRLSAGLLTGWLFGISAADPLTFVAIAVLTLVAVVASYLPARRATRVDPAATLRSG